MLKLQRLHTATIMAVSLATLAALVAMMMPAAATSQILQTLADGSAGKITYKSTFLENIVLTSDLQFPAKPASKYPVMIIAHSSTGLTSKEHEWAKWFHEHGIATFVIDYFTPRGITFKSAEQPDPEVDIYDAIKLLATHPKIDATRIGIIGFSRGGGLAVGTANDNGGLTKGIKTAVHISLYGACWSHIDPNPQLSPVLMMIGTNDSYFRARDCEDLAREGAAKGRIVKAQIYEGAYHAWDRGFNGTIYHPAAKTLVEVVSDGDVTNRSRQDILDFIRGPLKLD